MKTKTSSNCRDPGGLSLQLAAEAFRLPKFNKYYPHHHHYCCYKQVKRQSTDMPAARVESSVTGRRKF